MRRPILAAILAAILASLACTQVIVTPTPAPYNTLPSIIVTAMQAPSPTAVPASTPWVAVVRQFRVYLHKSPDGEVYTDRWLVAGQRVEIVEIRGDWVRVAGPGGGWVFIGCLDGLSEKGCTAK